MIIKGRFQRYWGSHIQRLLLLLLIVFLFSIPVFSEIIITEIFRDPTGSESLLCGGASHEFVEITNFGPETLFISNLFITDGSESDSIVTCSRVISGHERCLYGKKILVPGQTALILDPDYRSAVDSLHCTMHIEDSTVLWENGDKEIGNGLVSTDGLIIYRGTKSQIDTVLAIASDGEETLSKPNTGKLTCTVDEAAEGVSIVPTNSLQRPLAYSNNSSGLSPGKYEHHIDEWILEYKFINGGELQKTVSCSLMIRPVTVKFQERLDWSLFYDIGPSRKTFTSGEILPSFTTQTFSIELPLDTQQYFMAAGKSVREIDVSIIWTPAASLRINELFPRSIPNSEPEWFEITNISSMTINLQNWRFGCSENSIIMTTVPYYLKKGAFCIVTSNPILFKSKYPLVPNVVKADHWYTLNNSRDTLQLFNQSGIPVDTIYYDSDNLPEWKAQSIERIDASKNGTARGAWSVSENSTPGIPNSASSWRNTPSIFIDAGPVPFTPNNDGHDDLYKIICKIPSEQTITISILSFDGKVVKTFTGPSQPEYLWDGRDSRGKLIPNGPFFVVIKIDGDKKNSVIRKKGVIWR
jgi:hypothetical protein